MVGVTEFFYAVKARLRRKLGRDNLNNRRKYAGVACLDEIQMNEKIRKMVLDDEPFMVGRFGANEIYAMRSAQFNNKSGLLKSIDDMDYCAGFFPHDYKLLYKFNDIMKESCKETDLLGVWFLTCEDYFIRKCFKSIKNVGSLMSIEPWNDRANPWTAALKGKKVLVIHPFEKTIRSQYAKRELLFPGTDILPEFDLQVLRAVQTTGSATDDRFETWFDALQYMCDECDMMDFDIALIGCGAYGFPLAAHIKRSGRQAVHLGGVLQILFGIKGRRWDESDTHLMYNEHWVYPDASEIPAGADKVENACYWEVKKEEE